VAGDDAVTSMAGIGGAVRWLIRPGSQNTTATASTDSASSTGRTQGGAV